MLRCLCWIPILALLSTASAIGSADEASPTATRRHIENLGSRVAAVRVRAAIALVEIGEPALPELETTATTDSARREAIAELIDQIRWGVDLVPTDGAVETPDPELLDVTVLGELGFGPGATRNPKLVETLVRQMREYDESFARPSGEPPPALTRALLALDSLRAGFDTPFEEVERRGEALLASYSDPRERGRITAAVAHVYGQSGCSPRTAVWAEKALKLALEPELRLRMYEYVYSTTLLHGVEPAERAKPEGRRSLLRPALFGLREALRYDLPRAAPELPNIRLPADDSPESRRIHRRQVQARRVAEFARDMITNRDIHVDRIVEPATRSPEERDQLRALLYQESVAKALTRALRDVNVDPADGLRIAREAAGSGG
jgi:hypothetical protein